jgi:hypothetical protein
VCHDERDDVRQRLRGGSTGFGVAGVELVVVDFPPPRLHAERHHAAHVVTQG